MTEPGSGKKTEDYYLGRDLYHELKDEGYNVFFSAETLARVGEQEFEPYIYRALSTARVMLVLCSDNEKTESAWVKNEWSRFLDMRSERQRAYPRLRKQRRKIQPVQPSRGIT